MDRETSSQIMPSYLTDQQSTQKWFPPRRKLFQRYSVYLKSVQKCPKTVPVSLHVAKRMRNEDSAVVPGNNGEASKLIQ